jgi:hypothetical protein
MKFFAVRIASLVVLLAAFFTVDISAQEAAKSFSYVPEFHGAVRARWEMATESSESRFQVRNARFWVDGKVAPFITYKINTDLCDRGSMKILDAWGRLDLFKGFYVQMGQFRQPFGMDSFRAPNNYIFSNRSFIGKYLCNVRGVGAKVNYAIPRTPLSVEAGVCNPTGISDHNVWVKKYTFSGQAILNAGAWKVQAGMMSMPDSVRINLSNIAVLWQDHGWTASAEYMNRRYNGSDHKDTHGYVAYVNYKMPVKAEYFDFVSVNARFDGMTDYSSVKTSAVTTDQYKRNRLTIGSTLTYKKTKWLEADLRLNFEKYFYPSNVTYASTSGDALTLELALIF